MKKLIVLASALVALHAYGQPGCIVTPSTPPAFIPSGPTSVGQVKVFPVVVHVMYEVGDNTIGVGSNISDAQVLDAIQKLNDAYRNASGLSVDMEVEFCLAKIDPNGIPTNGIDRISMAAFPSYPNFIEAAAGSHTAAEGTFYANECWDPDRYLNIWVANTICSRNPFNGTLFCNGLWGTANIPSVQNYANQFLLNTVYDCIWLRNDEFGTIGTAANSSVGWLAHEVGHWLNLYHLADNDCANTDGISDTPIYELTTLNVISQGYVCGTPFVSSSCNTTIVPEYVMMGWLAQSFDVCMVKFTAGQRNVVDYSASLYRPNHYYIKGQAASTLCGCQGLTSFGSIVNLPSEFNIAKGLTTGLLYSPFDDDYLMAYNINPPTYSTLNYEITQQDVLLINADNLGSGVTGDFLTGNYIQDVVDNSYSIDFPLDGQWINVHTGGALTVGDNSVSSPRAANLILECSSLLEFGSGANVNLYNDSKIIVKTGGTLLIRSGANVTLHNLSRIEVEAGGYICVEVGGNIQLINPTNVIAISPTATFGVNPTLNVVASCSGQIPFSGQGLVTCLPAIFTDLSGAAINNGGITTWNASRIIKGQVVVSQNSTLIISGASTVIQFADSRAVGVTTNIIVEPGSTLIIDGATLKGDVECNSMWDGIQVWGVRTAPQLPYSSTVQGTVILKNNATIRDAKEGITVGNVDPITGFIDWNYTGGIVLAYNANFINCITGVNFLSYRDGIQNNLSYFKQCSFATSGLLNDATAFPKAFIAMYDVKGIRIIGCSFTNSTPGQYPTDKRGFGIVTIDAGYYVYDNCTSVINPCPASGLVHSRFENLSYGIYSTDATPINAIKVDNCDFVGNIHGALFRGMDYTILTRNRFDVGLFDGTYPPYGLYMEFCTAYQIDENQFTTSIPGNSQTTGLAIYGSGPQYNRFYNNRFDNLEVGSMIMENNDGPSVGDGLLVQCNDYGMTTGNTYDIAVTALGSMGEYQGSNVSPTSLAGNTFSHTCASGNNDFAAGGMISPILYTHHNATATSPSCFTPSTVALNTIFTPYVKATACPTSLTGCGIPCLKNKITDNQNQASALRTQIDNNDTEGLLNIIASGSNGQVNSALMDASPYLSDAVLIAAINRPSLLPPGILKDIILANSPVSSEVMEALNGVSLPNGVKEQIDAAQVGVSPRSILESQIAFYEGERELSINELIRIYLNDTTIIDGLDTVIMILKNENRVEYKCKLAAIYVQQGDYTSALALLDSLQAAGHDDNFCKLQRYIILLRQDVANCFKLKTDPETYDKIDDIAHEHGEGCANAQALLFFVFNTQFPEVLEFPNSSAQRISNENTMMDSEGNFKIYPNPASTSITVQLSDSLVDRTSVFEIQNIYGQVVYRSVESTTFFTVPIQNFSSGLYFCVTYGNGQAIETRKLVIKQN